VGLTPLPQKETPRRKTYIVSIQPHKAIKPTVVGNKMSSVGPRDQFRVDCLGVWFSAEECCVTVLKVVVTSSFPLVPYEIMYVT
jgi:hypothetical protein